MSEAVAPPAPADPIERKRCLREYGSILLMTLGIKAIVYAFSVMAFEILQHGPLAQPWGFWDIWEQWDSHHYRNIALHGYITTEPEKFNIVFYPFFPLLIRCFLSIGVPLMVAPLVVTTLGSCAAALLLYHITRLDYGPRVARRTVFFLLIFPTAYFLHTGLNESVFLALALGSFLAARQRKWVLAGLLGYLAALTRVNGIWLLPALLVEAYLEWREIRRWRWDWLFSLFTALGVGSYLLLNWRILGDPFAFMHIQKDQWHHSLTWPWNGIIGLWRGIQEYTPEHSHIGGWQELLFTLLGLGVCIAVPIAKMRPSYTIWCIGNWLLWTCLDFIISVPRYTMLLFPMYLLLGRLSPNSITYSLVVCWCLLTQGFFLSLWVRGEWAF